MPVLDPSLTTLASQQDGLLTRQQLLAAGWSPSAVKRGGQHWRTVLPAVYLTGEGDLDTDVRARAAALRWPRAALSHHTAARWRGWPLLDQVPAWDRWLPPSPSWWGRVVHVTCDSKLRTPSGYVAHCADPGELVNVRGARLTGDCRTLLDVMREAPLLVAVCLIDAVCRTDIALFDQLTIMAAGAAGHRGMTAAGRALGLANPLSESLLETLLRLLIILAGLPAPELQVRVRLGRMTYRADLGYPARRLLLEADGRNYHAKWADVAADMTRQNALVAAGWRVLRFTWKQVLFQPELVIEAIRTALAE